MYTVYWLHYSLRGGTMLTEDSQVVHREEIIYTPFNDYCYFWITNLKYFFYYKYMFWSYLVNILRDNFTRHILPTYWTSLTITKVKIEGRGHRRTVHLEIWTAQMERKAEKLCTANPQESFDISKISHTSLWMFIIILLVLNILIYII